MIRYFNFALSCNDTTLRGDRQSEWPRRVLQSNIWRYFLLVMSYYRAHKCIKKWNINPTDGIALMELA